MSEYPKVMRHRTDGVIVRFTASGIGTVLGRGHTGSTEQNVGYYSSEWYMAVFKDYKPELFRTKE